jgi:hypothetical protein
VFARREKRGARQRRLAGLAPSSYWINEINTGRVRHFPPRADHAPMVRCQSHHKSCARFYPSYYVPEARCTCDDCHNAFLLSEEERRRAEGVLPGLDVDDVGGTTSATTVALERLEAVAGEIPETLKEPLAGESDEDLRGEIVEHFVRTCFVDDAPPRPPRPTA